MSSKKRDLRIARAVRIRERATAQAFGEAVKDNMAERVIDNFVGELAALPFEARFKFALGVIRGNDENPKGVVEGLARAIQACHEKLLPFDLLDPDQREFKLTQARGMFQAAGIEA